MNKFYNRALLYRDMKRTKWVCLLFFILVFFMKPFKLLSSISSFKASRYDNSDIQYVFYGELFTTEGFLLVMIITLALFTLLLFTHEKKSSTYDLSYSMPFNRSEIIINKYLIGIGLITITFIINLLIISLIYGINFELFAGYVYFKDIMIWTLLNTLMFISIFSFLVFIQTITGNVFAGGVIGLIVLFIPFFLLGMIELFLKNRFNIIDSGYILKISQKLSLFMYSDVRYGENGLSLVKCMDNIIILIIVSIVLILLSIKLFKIIRLKNISNLVQFKLFNVIFKFGFAICFGLLISLFFNVNENNIIFHDIVFITSLVAGYYIAKLLCVISKGIKVSIYKVLFNKKNIIISVIFIIVGVIILSNMSPRVLYNEKAAQDMGTLNFKALSYFNNVSLDDKKMVSQIHNWLPGNYSYKEFTVKDDGLIINYRKSDNLTQNQYMNYWMYNDNFKKIFLINSSTYLVLLDDCNYVKINLHMTDTKSITSTIKRDDIKTYYGRRLTEYKNDWELWEEEILIDTVYDHENLQSFSKNVLFSYIGN